MPEIEETFSSYLARIEQVLPSVADKKIILASDLPEVKLLDGEGLSTTKTQILWPLYRHNMFYTIQVPPGTSIPRHQHDEAIFRYIIKGSLLLNQQITIEFGTWFVIRENTPYEIVTEIGYTAIIAYTSNCRTVGTAGSGKHVLPEDSYFKK